MREKDIWNYPPVAVGLLCNQAVGVAARQALFSRGSCVAGEGRVGGPQPGLFRSACEGGDDSSKLPDPAPRVGNCQAV